MEIFVVIFFIVFFALAVRAIPKRGDKFQRSDNKQHVEHLGYDYRAKSHLMTHAEEQFFKLLAETVSEKYYIFPQIHLSALLDHEVKGQSWKGAFAHINGKSIDYVLCDKSTLKPMYAIELDDYTHKHEKRVERDTRVERIFANAGIPLIRFTDTKSTNRNDIIKKLTETYRTLQ